MEGSHHVHWNSITYRKGAIQRTEMGLMILAGKDFNTKLVQLIPLCHNGISNSA